MSIGGSNIPNSSGILNAPGSGGITNAPLYGTPEQQIADPLHLFPTPTQGSPGVPSTLPNLGAKSMMPIQPYGRFVAPPATGGGFNGMAARNAGPLFNPSAGAPSWQALMAALAQSQATQAQAPRQIPQMVNNGKTQP